MSERLTETVKLSKTEAVIYAEATGGDIMDLEVAAAESGSMDRTGDMNIKVGTAYRNRLRKLSDLFIVSIGEAKEKEANWKALRDLPAADYAALMLRIDAVVSGITKEEGKA